MRRDTEPELASAIAHHAAWHEAGHAVAIVLAFRSATWLPKPKPLLPVKFVEITEHAPGRWSGNTLALDVYLVKWSIDRIAPRYRALMEAQLVIELADGIAEALARGARDQVFWFATRHCGMDTDRQRATAVLADLFHLTGHRYDKRLFAARALALLLAHWPAVEALARALLQHRRIEGERVVAIIDLNSVE